MSRPKVTLAMRATLQEALAARPDTRLWQLQNLLQEKYAPLRISQGALLETLSSMSFRYKVLSTRPIQAGTTGLLQLRRFVAAALVGLEAAGVELVYVDEYSCRNDEVGKRGFVPRGQEAWSQVQTR